MFIYIDLLSCAGLEASGYLLFSRETYTIKERGGAAKINLPALPYCEKGIAILLADSRNSDLKKIPVL